MRRSFQSPQGNCQLRQGDHSLEAALHRRDFSYLTADRTLEEVITATLSVEVHVPLPLKANLTFLIISVFPIALSNCGSRLCVFAGSL
jgi:hypothetical protein